MKNIEPAKAALLAKYAQQYCSLADPKHCQKQCCTCQLVAEVNALKKMVLPNGFSNYTLADFTGLGQNHAELLDPETALRAKTELSKYIYGAECSLAAISAMGDVDRNKKSADQMYRRHCEGRNVVIFGESKLEGRWGERGGVKEKPVGRTFAAAVLMHEAIKLRAHKGYHHYSYGWVNFSSLVDSLRNDSYEASNYQSCDWLVVDNITGSLLNGSDKMKSYLELQIDPFFSSRLEQRLPTILVFKFDIRKAVGRMEEAFGVSINQIINMDSTAMISLCEG